MNPLKSLLEKPNAILADGATGTMLMAQGLEQGDSPERWNLLYPERIRAMHQSYIAFGAQIILTNSFGGTRFRLKLHNLHDQVRELNRSAAELARAEVASVSHTVVVAGSMGPSGELLEPLGELTFEEARDGFAEQAAALTEGGADVLWIETMSDLNEVRAAAEGAREVSSLPLVITMTFDTNGHTMMGVSPIQALKAIREFSPIALGGNCGNGPDEIESVIQAMHAADPSIPLVAKSNAGIPELVDGKAEFCATPTDMAKYAVRVRNLGARIIGGCCGNTPAHVRAMAEALENNPFQPIDPSPIRQSKNGTPRRSRKHRRNTKRRRQRS